MRFSAIKENLLAFELIQYKSRISVYVYVDGGRSKGVGIVDPEIRTMV
jgi:hypothetical protein